MTGEPLFLTLDEILQIHADQLARYGGSEGVRDMGLLESALHAPAASFGGEYLLPDLASMAAAYLFHIAKNHGFVDGNKRTGAAAAIVFLEMNTIPFDVEPMELAELTENIAAGRAMKEDAVSFFRRHITQAE